MKSEYKYSCFVCGGGHSGKPIFEWELEPGIFARACMLVASGYAATINQLVHDERARIRAMEAGSK